MIKFLFYGENLKPDAFRFSCQGKNKLLYISFSENSKRKTYIFSINTSSSLKEKKFPLSLYFFCKNYYYSIISFLIIMKRLKKNYIYNQPPIIKKIIDNLLDKNVLSKSLFENFYYF